MNINEKTTIYVLCPAYSKTGGPELLHQLVYTLNKQGKRSYITYYNTGHNQNYTDVSYQHYIEEYKLEKDIVDDEDSIIIFPEIYFRNISNYQVAKKIIWWLSVDNYLKGYRIMNPIRLIGVKGFFSKIKNKELFFTNKKMKMADAHFCQSYYAIDFLKNHGIKSIFYLSDYLNDIYLNSDIKIFEKENNVLYNPKKGYKYTKKIIKNSEDLNWIPIKNLTNSEVRNLLLRSKVYIDFGNHPGKDRFPREAAMSNCCIITGKKGAANFKEDVFIKENYKFDDINKNIPLILNKIHDCLENYDNNIENFINYKEMIIKEKEKFYNDVNSIFVKEKI